MTKTINRKFRISNVIITVALACMAITVLLPVLFVVSNSFMDEHEIAKSYGRMAGGGGKQLLPHIIPERATLAQYAEVFWLRPDYLVKFWNSMLLAVAIVAGQLVVSCFAGYGFAKFSFPFKNAIFFLFIALMMMPHQVTLVPQYIMLGKMGLIGSYASVILPGITAPFGIFLLTQVFASVPDSVIEAAKIDGANAVQVLLGIVAPQGRTGIAALAMLCFIDAWNMVEQPLVFLSDPRKYPMSIFLAGVNLHSLGVAFVCGLLAMLPVTIIFLYLKDSLVYGIEMSNLK